MRHKWRFLLFLAFLVLLYYVAYHSPWASHFALAGIRQTVEASGAWSFVVFPLLYALVVLLFVPSFVMDFLGAVLFGLWLGTILNVAGSVLAACLTFGLSEWLGRDFVQDLVRGKLVELRKKLNRNGFRTVLFFRVFPVMPFIWVNYAAGLSRIRFKDYFWATAIGLWPSEFVYTLLFVILGEAMLTKSSWQFSLALGLLVLFFLSPYLYRWIRSRGA